MFVILNIAQFLIGVFIIRLGLSEKPCFLEIRANALATPNADVVVTPNCTFLLFPELLFWLYLVSGLVIVIALTDIFIVLFLPLYQKQ